MAIKEPEAPSAGAKGLQAGALGLVGNVVIGLAADAEVDVVLVVREEMPDGLTLESALKKLNWDDADLLVVGSSRFARAAPNLFGLHRRSYPDGHGLASYCRPRAAAL